MIVLTRLDGKEFLLNEDLIEIVNETPDTVIVLGNGHSYIVRESLNELQQKIRESKRLIRRGRLSDKAEKPLT